MLFTNIYSYIIIQLVRREIVLCYLLLYFFLYWVKHFFYFFIFRNFSCKAGPASRFWTWWLFAKSWFHETEDSVWRSSQKNVQTSSLHRLPRSHSCKSHSGYCISGNNYSHISINVFLSKNSMKNSLYSKTNNSIRRLLFHATL